MRLGDRIKINLENKNTLIGIITYLEQDNNYGEISTKIFNTTSSSNHTIEPEDWFSFNFRVDVTNTEASIYAKSNTNHYNFLHVNTDNEFKLIITEENENGDFFTTKYTNKYEKNIESNRLYHVITTQKNIEFEPGTLFEIVSVDKEFGSITCYNYTARKNQKLFPNKTPIFNEEIIIDVKNGISKVDNNYIIDFCELIEDSDTEGDTDSELEQVDEGFSIKGKLLDSEIELTDDQKRETISSSISEMFADKVSDKDKIIIINNFFNALDEKYEIENDWKNNLEKFLSGGIIPILDEIKKSDIDTESEDYINLDYSGFIENHLKPLIINDIGFTIKNRTHASFIKTNNSIVLNQSYIYPYSDDKSSIIENTADTVNIKGFLVKGTNKKFNTLPPSPQIFSNIYDIIGNNIFKVFDTSISDIPMKYLKKLNLVEDKLSSLSIHKNISYNRNKYYRDLNKPIDKVTSELSVLPTSITESKPSSKDISPLIKDFLWDNNQVWPRSLIFSELENEKTISKEELSFFLNRLEGKNIGNNSDYYYKLNQNVDIKDKKSEDKVKFSNSYNPPPKIQVRVEEEKLSKTLIVWKEADKITDRVLRSKEKLRILNCGEYVRNSEINGEHPYYFIDIFTEKQCFPKHILLQLEADIVNKKEEALLNKCLINQWGEDESGTKNIISLINGDIIGSTENDFDYDMITHSSILHKQSDIPKSDIHIGSELDIYAYITKNIFLNGLIEILNKLSVNKQYSNSNILTIDNYKEPYNMFFNNSNEWRTYVSFFSFDESDLDVSDIPVKLVKNLSRFSTKLKNTNKALKTFPKNNDMTTEKSQKLLRKLKKRVISEIKDTKKEFEKQIYGIAALYLASYVYSNVIISHEARINTILSVFTDSILFDKVDKTQINEANIVSYSIIQWNYTNNIKDKYNYSYKLSYGTYKYTSIYKRSFTVISKKVKTIKPTIPNINCKKSKTIESYSYTHKKSHKLGKHWEKYYKNKLSLNKIEWAEIYNDKDISKEEIELQYKCLSLQIVNLLLKPKPTEKFTLPKIWSILSEKGQLEKIRDWLSDTYNVTETISSIKDYDEFVEVVRHDLIEFRRFISTNHITSWKDIWLHLIQHLLHEMDTLNLTFPDYREILESVVRRLIESEEIFCGESIIMTRSRVEDIHAIVEEDEARTHIGTNSNKDSQKTTREDMKRNLGRYLEGTRTQFDIKTVLDAKESLSPVELSDDNTNPDTMFNTDFGQNFDDDHGNDD